MAFLSPPTWLENATDHSAQDYRTMLASLVRTGGVASSTALAVSEKSGTANMSVDVAAGGVFVASTRSTAQGTYHAYNDATVNVTIDAADATNPRIDRVIVQIRDEAQDAALTQNDARLLVVKGTAAASPTAPTISVADYVELAQVTVGAGVTSITNANITDQRTVAKGGLRPTLLRARLSRSATQSIPTATSTAITWTVEDSDPNGMHAASSSQIIIPAGTPSREYLVGASLEFDANSTGTRIVSILKNGSIIVREESLTNTSPRFVTLAPSVLINATAGDIFTVEAYQTSGSALNIRASTAYSPKFWIAEQP